MRRYPLAPLVARLGIDPTATGAARALAHELGIDRSNAHRLLAAGTVSDRQADRYALAIGLHPVLVWPDWCHPDTVPDDAADVA